MAFYDEDEDENGQGESAPGGIQTGPQASVITGQGQGGAGTASAPNKPDSGGSFVGLKQYIDANKPQAAKLGDQTAGIINQSGDQVRSGIQALNQEAQEKIKPVQTLDLNLSEKLHKNAEQLSNDERQQIKNTASAQYKGPQTEMDLSSYQAASDAANKARQNIQNSGTEEGRMGLISQINSKPRTQGMNVFDNVLLQAGGGREKLAQAAQATTGAVNQLGQAAEGIRSSVGRADDPSTPDVDESSGAIGQTNKAQADAFTKIQDAMSAWKADFVPKVEQKRQSLIDQQNRLSRDFGNDQFSLDQDTMEAIGLSGGERIYDMDLKNYLNSVGALDITPASVATEEDYARQAALMDLSGEQYDYLKREDARPISAFNKDKFLADRIAAEQAFNQLAGSSTVSGRGTAQGPNGQVAANARQLVNDYLARGVEYSSVSPEQQYVGSSTPRVIDAITNASTGAKVDLGKNILDWLHANYYNNQIKKNG